MLSELSALRHSFLLLKSLTRPTVRAAYCVLRSRGKITNWTTKCGGNADVDGAVCSYCAPLNTHTCRAGSQSTRTHIHIHIHKAKRYEFSSRDSCWTLFRKLLAWTGREKWAGSRRWQAAVRVLASHGLLLLLWQLLLLVAPLTCIVALYTQIERGQSADSGQTATVAGD